MDLVRSVVNVRWTLTCCNLFLSMVSNIMTEILVLFVYMCEVPYSAYEIFSSSSSVARSIIELFATRVRNWIASPNINL